MPSNHVKISLHTQVQKTPRVMQCAGLFDIDVNKKLTREWDHQLPLEEKAWQVGLIVGASGAGKTQLANRLFGAENVRETFRWGGLRSLMNSPKA